MKKILNIGCGADTYGTHFVDIYPKRPEVKKCDVDIEDLPFPDGFFDEIYAKFIFEHLKNPNVFLKKCFRKLKKGGKLTLITDNAGCWVFHFPLKFLYSQQHYDNIVREGMSDKHYSLYTPLHLKNHLSEARYNHLKTKYIWFENKTTTSKNKFLFAVLSSFARIISIILPQKNSYPHIMIQGWK